MQFSCTLTALETGICVPLAPPPSYDSPSSPVSLLMLTFWHLQAVGFSITSSIGGFSLQEKGGLSYSHIIEAWSLLSELHQDTEEWGSSVSESGLETGIFFYLDINSPVNFLVSNTTKGSRIRLLFYKMSRLTGLLNKQPQSSISTLCGKFLAFRYV